jgi:hypothetical protein
LGPGSYGFVRGRVFFDEHLPVHAHGDCANGLARGGVGDRHAELRLQRLGRFIGAHLADMNRFRAQAVGFLPFGLVALPVIRRDVALADIQALVVHDEDFRIKALRLGFDLLQICRQLIVQDGFGHGAAA